MVSAGVTGARISTCWRVPGGMCKTRRQGVRGVPCGALFLAADPHSYLATSHSRVSSTNCVSPQHDEDSSPGCIGKVF